MVTENTPKDGDSHLGDHIWDSDNDSSERDEFVDELRSNISHDLGVSQTVDSDHEFVLFVFFLYSLMLIEIFSNEMLFKHFSNHAIKVDDHFSRKVNELAIQVHVPLLEVKRWNTENMRLHDVHFWELCHIDAFVNSFVLNLLLELLDEGL